MLKKMNKSVLLAMLTLGVLFVLVTPDAMAQDRCRSRSRSVGSNYNNVGYYDNRNTRDRNYRNSTYRDNSNYRDSSYYGDDRYYNDYEDTTGNAVKRTAIGAGIGTLGGAVIGGKKGALIGAGIGAAGGYIYHRNRVSNGRRY